MVSLYVLVKLGTICVWGGREREREMWDIKCVLLREGVYDMIRS